MLTENPNERWKRLFGISDLYAPKVRKATGAYVRLGFLLGFIAGLGVASFVGWLWT